MAGRTNCLWMSNCCELLFRYIRNIAYFHLRCCYGISIKLFHLLTSLKHQSSLVFIIHPLFYDIKVRSAKVYLNITPIYLQPQSNTSLTGIPSEESCLPSYWTICSLYDLTLRKINTHILHWMIRVSYMQTERQGKPLGNYSVNRTRKVVLVTQKHRLRIPCFPLSSNKLPNVTKSLCQPASSTSFMISVTNQLPAAFHKPR